MKTNVSIYFLRFIKSSYLLFLLEHKHSDKCYNHITMYYSFLWALKRSLCPEQMHKEGGQKHTKTGSGKSHTNALNLKCLTLNPRKHVSAHIER